MGAPRAARWGVRLLLLIGFPTLIAAALCVGVRPGDACRFWAHDWRRA